MNDFLAQAIDIASDRIERQVNRPDVEEFYVGRTSDPERRKVAHDADKLVIVFRNDSDDLIADLEEQLIEIWGRHPKNSNRSPFSEGAWSPRYKSVIYVALWYG